MKAGLSVRSRWLLLHMAERHPLGIARTNALLGATWQTQPGMVHMRGLIRRGWAREGAHGIFFLTDAGENAAHAIAKATGA